MQEHNEDWPAVFKAYEIARKPNGDAVQDLSLQNYLVMRDKVSDPAYQLQQKIERRISEIYPNHYFPLYSMVSFSDIEYKVALEKGNLQSEMISDIIQNNHITSDTPQEQIDAIIHHLFDHNPVL